MSWRFENQLGAQHQLLSCVVYIHKCVQKAPDVKADQQERAEGGGRNHALVRHEAIVPNVKRKDYISC